MRRWIVVDTNVLVSGVFGVGTSAAPRRILDAMLAGEVRFVVSEELVFEYRRVLLLPRISRRHGLDEGEVDRLLTALLENGALRRPAADSVGLSAARETNPAPAVPGDEHIVDLLRTEPRALLVTGDRILASAVGHWREVSTPALFAVSLGPVE